MKRLVIILDAFLKGNQKLAQICHGVAAFGLKCPEEFREWNNGTIIVKQTKDIDAWEGKCDASFREPYWENRLTVLAAYRPKEFDAELPPV